MPVKHTLLEATSWLESLPVTSTTIQALCSGRVPRPRLVPWAVIMSPTKTTVAGGQVGEEPVSREPQPLMGALREILGMVVKG